MVDVMTNPKKIQECFKSDRVYYSRYDRDEMENEEFGEISNEEAFEAILTGKIIENYPEEFIFMAA